MPVRKTKGGYKWGNVGKTYKTRAEAERQGRAIRASQNKKDKKDKPKAEPKAKSGYKWDDKKKDK